MSKHQVKNLTIRFYRGQDDDAAIAALDNAAAVVDGPEYGKTENEVSLMLAGPLVMPKENAFLFEVDDQLVAFGRTVLEESPDESLFFVRGIVHPDWRRRGIGTRVMERVEQRIQERLPEAKNQTVYVGAETRLESQDRRALFGKMGYEVIRYFFEMECPLTGKGSHSILPEPVYPPGIQVLSMAERADLKAVWRATDEAFSDHWGNTDTTLEQWEHWTSAPDYRPERWLVAWDVEKDEVAGACLNGIEPAHNERVGRKEGWVFALAVRRTYRHRGLGGALLRAGMRVLQQAGMDYAMLGVDTENLTGALRLYESAGFQPVKRYVAYRKQLRG